MFPSYRNLSANQLTGLYMMRTLVVKRLAFLSPDIILVGIEAKQFGSIYAARKPGQHTFQTIVQCLLHKTLFVVLSGPLTKWLMWYSPDGNTLIFVKHFNSRR